MNPVLILKEDTRKTPIFLPLLLQVLISRGLQLEGQVVTEDQDLQVMVTTSQKNSPIQYLHASAMQERVRGAVAQSQVCSLLINTADTLFTTLERVRRTDRNSNTSVPIDLPLSGSGGNAEQPWSQERQKQKPFGRTSSYKSLHPG